MSANPQEGSSRPTVVLVHGAFAESANRRLEYINVFWNVVNRREVAGRYKAGHS